MLSSWQSLSLLTFVDPRWFVCLHVLKYTAGLWEKTISAKPEDPKTQMVSREPTTLGCPLTSIYSPWYTFQCTSARTINRHLKISTQLKKKKGLYYPGNTVEEVGNNVRARMEKGWEMTKPGQDTAIIITELLCPYSICTKIGQSTARCLRKRGLGTPSLNN